MLLSVVVPVHNAAPWLEECLVSIEAQTVGTLEVLCVDDGSTDVSASVLERAAARWANLTVYYQECKGVSAARNLGLSHARGDYVLFVDADDVLDPRLVERVLPVAHGLDADVTVFGFEEYWGRLQRTVPRRMCEEPLLKGHTFSLEDMAGLSTTLTTPNVWRMLWKRSFIEVASLRFHEDLPTSEDLAFIYEALFSHPRIALVNEVLYRYRRDGGETLTRADRGLAGYRALEYIRDRVGATVVLEEGPLVRHFVNLVLDVAEYAMGSAATEMEYRALYDEFQRVWRTCVEPWSSLVAPRYRAFWEAMQRGRGGEDYLFELYGRTRGELERLRAGEGYVALRADDVRSTAGSTAATIEAPVPSGGYARVLLVTETPVVRATVADRALWSLRRAGHAVLPWSTGGANAALRLATAVRSFAPTVVLGDRPLAAYGPAVAEALRTTGLPYVKMPTEVSPDDAYWRLKTSKQDLMRRGILCTQRYDDERGAQLEAICAATESPLVALESSWPQFVGLDRPGFDRAYYARTTTFAVYFEGADAPTTAEIALRVAEGNTVLCERGVKDGVENAALRDALVGFEAGGLPDLVKEMKNGSVEVVYRAQCEAVRALRSLEDALDDALRQVDMAQKDAGLSAVLAYNQRAVTVGLYGWFGAHNFGDDLLMRLTIERLGLRYPNLYPWVIGANPKVIGEEFGYEAYEPGEKYAIAALLRGSRALVYCGGLIFDDPMASTAGDCEFVLDPWIEPSGQAAIALLAQGLGVRSVFFGGGAGPVAQDATRTAVRLMGLADMLFLCRDQASCDLMVEAGVRPEQVRLRADLAYGARAYLEEQIAGSMELPVPEGPYFMVSLRRWPLNPPDFVERMAKALDAIVEATGCTAVFVPFDAEDAVLHREIAGFMLQDGGYVVYDSRPSEGLLFSLLQGSKFAVAMRLHCSILHHVLGKPAVGLNYNEKVVAHFEKVGEKARLIELDCDPDTVARVALEAWGGREAIAERVLSSIEAGARMVDVAAEELYGVIDAASTDLREPQECYPRMVGRHLQALQVERRACKKARGEATRLQGAMTAAQNDIQCLRDECERLEREGSANIMRLTGERDTFAQEIENIHASRSFKLGRALLWVPYRLRQWWRMRK